jgi:hypothetical protein
MVGLLAGCWDQRYPRLIVHGIDRECGRRSIATRGLGADNVTLVRVSHAHEGGEAGADEFHRVARTSLLSPTSPAASRGALVRYEGTREWVPPRHRLALPQVALPQVALQRSTRLTSQRSSRRRVLAYRAEGSGRRRARDQAQSWPRHYPPRIATLLGRGPRHRRGQNTRGGWREGRVFTTSAVEIRFDWLCAAPAQVSIRTIKSRFARSQIPCSKLERSTVFLTYGALAVFAWPALVVCIEGGNGDPLWIVSLRAHARNSFGRGHRTSVMPADLANCCSLETA